jgi:hypothetical protein
VWTHSSFAIPPRLKRLLVSLLPRDQLEKWKTKVDKWSQRISSGKLPAGFTWVSYTHQLWMGLRYGLGCLPADMDEVKDFLQDENYKILPFLGVARTIKKGWCTIHRAFCGIGLFSFPVELLIARANMFLQHFDSPHSIDVVLRACLQLVQLEAGFQDCPFDHPFDPIGKYLTKCWIRCNLSTFSVSKLNWFTIASQTHVKATISSWTYFADKDHHGAASSPGIVAASA